MLDNKTGIHTESKGGTELVRERIISQVPMPGIQLICSRVRDLDPDKKKILWLHDYWNDPENQSLRDESYRNQFERFVFVSQQQFHTYHLAYGIPYSKSVIIENCIEPINNINKSSDEIRLIYHTTPHRGLEILIPVFEHVSQYFPNVILDVYSSFNIYGKDWESRNEPYKPLFERCKNHPKINYHGSVSNEEIRNALAKSHIFAYPSIWPETSCLAAIEAMSAECLVVCPDLAALSETVSIYGLMYRFNEDPNVHANIFAKTLIYAIQNMESSDIKLRLTLAKNRVNLKYNSIRAIALWKNLVDDVNGT